MNSVRQSTLPNGYQALDGADRLASPQRITAPVRRKKKETSIIRMDAALKLLTTVLLTVATALAQSSDRLPVTDAEKIADALRAGPEFITKDATVLDWPSSPGGEFRVLRTGTSAWTCLPGIPQGTHDEPGCFDQVFLKFMKDSMAGRTPNVQSVGISYMYGGFW